jgi:Holliday junction resolvase RusA-like endonuclease
MTPPSAITFTVQGMAPAPQGSRKHIGNGRTIESCKQVKPWRLLVAEAATTSGATLLRGPVSMSCVFLFNRPKGHFTAKGTLRPSAPAFHCVKPDGSKLLRSTEDALSKLIYEDDARIVSSSFLKRYTTGTEYPGAIITIIPL